METGVRRSSRYYNEAYKIISKKKLENEQQDLERKKNY